MMENLEEFNGFLDKVDKISEYYLKTLQGFDKNS